MNSWRAFLKWFSAWTMLLPLRLSAGQQTERGANGCLINVNNQKVSSNVLPLHAIRRNDILGSREQSQPIPHGWRTKAAALQRVLGNIVHRANGNHVWLSPKRPSVYLTRQGYSKFVPKDFAISNLCDPRGPKYVGGYCKYSFCRN